MLHPLSYPAIQYSALATGYLTILYSAQLTELSHYPIVLYHWAIPLSHNALPTELSHYPIMLYRLGYPPIPAAHLASSLLVI